MLPMAGVVHFNVYFNDLDKESGEKYMGIVSTLYKLSESEYENLPADDFDVVEKLIPPDIYDNPNFYDLDKDWSVMHYLLCGSVEPDGSVQGDVILGGESTRIEMDYGPVCYRSAQRVQEISNALRVFDLKKTIQNLSLSPGAIKEIYLGEEIVGEGLELLAPRFNGLQEFYGKAAKEGKIVLSYLA